jgi:serine/threonine protein kinase/Flp pilus assembly protein TadD
VQPREPDDSRVIPLVELALAAPPEERQSRLETACMGDTELFQVAWDCVQWELRMGGFLQTPLIAAAGNGRPFEPGQLLQDRFRITREVARGGMGVVYEAHDEKLDRRIAVKCAMPEFRKRLPPEARNATEVSHPNVCKIFEIHTVMAAGEELEFLTMEFLDGETLSERLRRGPLPPKEARTIAAQLCAGLAEAHRRNVIHGDLKSGNVIVTREPGGGIRAVITDFGLARGPNPNQQITLASVAGGTPDYMSPELRSGEKATAASDIYALGVILRELTSRHGAVADEEHAAAPWLWRRVVARCLDPDPARRFRGAEEVARALSPISRRWLLAAAAAVLLAVASGVVTYQRATAPRESVKLAVLPLEAGADAAALGSGMWQSVAAQVARIRGGKRARVDVIPFADVTRAKVGEASTARTVFGATHAMRGTLRRDGDNIVLHAFVTDTRTQANVGEREFRYAPGELRYAPSAVAGVVTAALRLPSAVPAGVNAAAREDYTAGVAYTRRNSTIDRALPLLERAVAHDPDSPLTWAALAEAQWYRYFMTEDRAWLVRASESLRQAQNRNPDAAAVHRMTGVLRANAGAYEESAAEYLRAIELEPPNADAYRRLGQVYLRDNQLGPALAAFQKAVEQEPTYFRVYQDLGAYYSQRGDSHLAIRELEKSVGLAPEEAETHYALGTAYSNAGRYVEAERELRAAIALGEPMRALNNLANALMHQGKDAEAIPFLKRALERFPDRYLWWMNLGNAYRRANLRKDSMRAYRRSLELAETQIARNPRDGIVRARLAYVCARLADRRRAESEVAQALQTSPQSIDVRVAAVWTYEALGRREDSLGILRASADEVLVQALRQIDLADLRQDSRFKQLVDSRRIQ